MHFTLTSKKLGLIGCIVLLACSSESKEAPAAAPTPPVAAAPSAAPAPAPSPTPAAAATPAGPIAEDPTFKLEASAAGPYTANTLGHFAVTLTPKGEFHVNEEYPIAIQVSAPPTVTLPKASLEKVDAAEVTAKTARFDVPVTLTQAGEHRVTAKVSFAVCTPENCMPDERTLELALVVP